MSDNPIATLNDLLNADMSNVDTAYPVISAGLKELIIAESKQVSNKDQTGQVWELHLKTTLPDKNAKTGADVSPGFTIIHRVGLSTTEKYTIDMIRRAVAIVKEAVFGDKNVKVQFADFTGRTVLAQLSVKDDPQFGTQNRITRFVPRKS